MTSTHFVVPSHGFGEPVALPIQDISPQTFLDLTSDHSDDTGQSASEIQVTLGRVPGKKSLNVFAGSKHIGTLAPQDVQDYPGLDWILGAGLHPLVTARFALDEDGIPTCSVILPPPGLCVPANNPPEVRWVLLEGSTAMAVHMDAASLPTFPEAEQHFLVDLRAKRFLNTRSVSAYVDGAFVGTLSREDAHIIADTVVNYHQSGLVAVARGHYQLVDGQPTLTIYADPEPAARRPFAVAAGTAATTGMVLTAAAAARAEAAIPMTGFFTGSPLTAASAALGGASAATGATAVSSITAVPAATTATSVTSVAATGAAANSGAGAGGASAAGNPGGGFGVAAAAASVAAAVAVGGLGYAGYSLVSSEEDTTQQAAGQAAAPAEQAAAPADQAAAPAPSASDAGRPDTNAGVTLAGLQQAAAQAAAAADQAAGQAAPANQAAAPADQAAAQAAPAVQAAAAEPADQAAGQAGPAAPAAPAQNDDEAPATTAARATTAAPTTAPAAPSTAPAVTTQPSAPTTTAPKPVTQPTGVIGATVAPGETVRVTLPVRLTGTAAPASTTAAEPVGTTTSASAGQSTAVATWVTTTASTGATETQASNRNAEWVEPVNVSPRAADTTTGAYMAGSEGSEWVDDQDPQPAPMTNANGGAVWVDDTSVEPECSTGIISKIRCFLGLEKPKTTTSTTAKPAAAKPTTTQPTAAEPTPADGAIYSDYLDAEGNLQPAPVTTIVTGAVRESAEF